MRSIIFSQAWLIITCNYYLMCDTYSQTLLPKPNKGSAKGKKNNRSASLMNSDKIILNEKQRESNSTLMTKMDVFHEW